MKMNRTDRKRRRKNKKAKFIVFLLISTLSLVLVAFTFGYIQYKTGLKNSATVTSLPEDDYEFNGVADSSGKVNVLLLGVDARGKEVSRADTIMIAQYDPKTGISKIASIMRDVYIDIPGYKKQKINAANAIGGPELVRKTIKHNFDIDVQYYAFIDFKGFSQVIDVAFPEGLEINVEKKMTEGIGLTLQPGTQKLNGDQVLGYVRFRKDAKSDFGRVERQQEVLGKITEVMSNPKQIVRVPKMIGTMQPFLNSNISEKTLLTLSSKFIFNHSTIKNIRIPVDGAYQPASIPRAGSVLDINLEKNKRALQQFFNEEGK